MVQSGQLRRREFISLLGSAAASWPLKVGAQNSNSKVYRIGILETQAATTNAANMNAFRQGLRVLGYEEGKNLIIEYRSVDGRGDLFPKLAAELLRLPVDVFVTRGTPAVMAAKNATASVPIVGAAMGEPLMVVGNLARPTGNVTGLSSYSTDLEAKRIELLHELAPQATRIAGLYNMGNTAVPPQWNELQTAAQTLGLSSQLLDVRTSDQIRAAFDAAVSRRAEMLAVGMDGLAQANRKSIAELAAKHRLPTIYVSREFIEVGGLMAYGPSYPDLYRRAAIYVDKILRGTKPTDLPVEQPTKFELIINLKAAKALGLEIPPSLLIRADEIVE
jgi:putative ABC transport system substrate-binding protein